MSLIFTKTQKEKSKKIWVRQAYNSRFVNIQEENLLLKREQQDTISKREIFEDQSEEERDLNDFQSTFMNAYKNEDSASLNYNFYDPHLTFEENFFKLLKEDFENGHEGFLLNELKYSKK
jgi:hypothetical protein